MMVIIIGFIVSLGVAGTASAVFSYHDGKKSGWTFSITAHNNQHTLPSKSDRLAEYRERDTFVRILVT